MITAGIPLTSQNLSNECIVKLRVTNFKVCNDFLYLDIKTTSKIFHSPSL